MGHSDQRSFLKRIYFSGKLPQAMLFAGVSGVGKKIVAKELIRTIFCDKLRELLEASRASREHMNEYYGGCGECKACKLFDAKSMPDYYELDCINKEEANTESVRELLYALNLRAFHGDSKVVLLDNAEYLNTQSANALLKSLEEPRSGTYYFLICANPYRLPPTLLSRCQIWYFDELSREQIRSALASIDASVDTQVSVDELCLIADGSLEYVAELSSHSQVWRELQNNLTGIASGEIALAIDFAAELAKDKASLRTTLRLMRALARFELHQKSATAEGAIWGQLLLDVIACERLIYERNLSPAQLLSVVFLRLAEGRGKTSFTSSLYDATFLDQQLFA